MLNLPKHSKAKSSTDSVSTIASSSDSYDYGTFQRPSFTTALASSASANSLKSRIQQTSNALWPKILDVFIACIMGANFNILKSIGMEVKACIGLALRSGLCTIAVLPYLLIAKHNVTAVKYGLWCGIPAAIGDIAQALALQRISLHKVAYLCNLHILILPFVKFALGKKVQGAVWSAAILTIIGVVILQSDGITLNLRQDGLGCLFAILQAAAYAVSYFIAGEGLTQYPSSSNVLSFTASYFASCGTLALLWVLIDLCMEGTSGILSLSLAIEKMQKPFFALSILWAGIGSTLLTAYGENIVLTRISASEHTILLSTAPLWSLFVSSFYMKEHIHANVVVGGFIIILACMLLQGVSKEPVEEFEGTAVTTSSI